MSWRGALPWVIAAVAIGAFIWAWTGWRREHEASVCWRGYAVALLEREEAVVERGPRGAPDAGAALPCGPAQGPDQRS